MARHHVLVMMMTALAGCATAPQTRPAPLTAAPCPQPIAAAPVPPAAQAAPSMADNGLNDLAATTFGCPKAALNAAARELAKVPSQGTYQFAYFSIVSDSHHAAYEVHFKSNYQGEPLLRYCVAIYCQQGWDPNNTQANVTLLSDEAQPPKAEAACGGKHQHAGARHIQ